MGAWSFARKGITRKKNRSLFLLSSQAACVFAGAFSLQLVYEFGFGLEIGSFSIAAIVGGFLWFIVLLSMVTSTLFFITSAHSLSYLRAGDTALMVAVGGSYDKIHSYLLAEEFLLALLGSLIGGGASIVIFKIAALFFFSGNAFSNWAFLLPIIAFIGFSLLFSYAAGAYILIKNTRLNFEELLGSRRSLRKNHFMARFKFFKKTPIQRLSLKNISRFRSLATSQEVAIAGAIAILVTLLLGNAISRDASTSYVENGVGEEVVLVGEKPMVDLVSNGFRVHGELPTLPDIDFFLEQLIPPETLEAVSNLDVFVDARFIIPSNVTEVPTYILDPEGSLETGVVGEFRSMEAFAIGVDPNPEGLVHNWIIRGNFDLSSSVVIGDSIDPQLFDDVFLQKIRIPGTGEISWIQRPVSGIVLDPFFRGKTVYIPRSELTTLFQVPAASSNIIFLKPTQNQALDLGVLESIVSKFGLTVKSLKEVNAQNQADLEALWILILLSSLPVSGAISISLLSYLMIVVESRSKECEVLRAIGAKKGDLTRMFSWEIFFLLPRGILLGIAIGIYTISWLPYFWLPSFFGFALVETGLFALFLAILEIMIAILVSLTFTRRLASSKAESPVFL